MAHHCSAAGWKGVPGQQQQRQKRRRKSTFSAVELIAAAALTCWLPGAVTSASSSSCPLLDWNYCARVVFLSAGMTCDLVQVYYGITPDRFEMLNPLLNCNSLPDNCMGCIENMAPNPGPWQTENPSPSPPSPPRPPRPPKITLSPPPPPPPTIVIPSPAKPPPPPFTRVFRYLPPRPPSPPPRPPVLAPPLPPPALPAPPPPLRHPYPPRPPPRAPPFAPFPPLNPIANPPQLPKSPPPPPNSPPPPYQYLSPPPFWWASPPPRGGGGGGGGGGAFQSSPPPPQIINPWISPPPVPSQPPPPPVVLPPDDPSFPTSPYYVNRADVLTRHNMYRNKHQIISLAWSDELAAAAQVWANNCWFEHSQYAYGENVAVGMPSIDAAIDAWYREIKLYNFAFPGFTETTGHFTQLVWASTMRVGCAIGVCPNGVQVASSTWNGKLLVCEYDPPGNAWGSFRMNVYPSVYQRKKEL